MGIFIFFSGTALEKGNKLANKKRFAEAVPYLVQAVELNQQPAFAAMKLGFCYQFIGKLPEAEKAFGLAVQLNPANVQGWVMCSIVQGLQGRFKDAEATAKQGLCYSVSENQELDCCLAILQALVMHIEAVGYKSRSQTIVPQCPYLIDGRARHSVRAVGHDFEKAARRGLTRPTHHGLGVVGDVGVGGVAELVPPAGGKVFSRNLSRTPALVDRTGRRRPPVAGGGREIVRRGRPVRRGESARQFRLV